MKFRQSKEDGSCDLIFSDEEIESLNKNKKLHFTPETLKTFGNVLVHMVGTFNSNFKEELQNKMTKPDEKVNLK
jgi:hypothetical protein|tara:strand:+ start:8922 stop:9143 length:222 start_codon:yes stop_codon:yes gene_type:complete